MRSHWARSFFNRVAATPTTVAQLSGLGYDVVIESRAGLRASFPDRAYADAGAEVVDAILLK